MEKKSDRKSTKQEYLKLVLALAILLIIALTFILYLSWPLLTGKTVILALMPVDPFDILRGQYQTLNYQISSVPSIEGAEVGEKVFVSLKENSSGVWQYESASLVKPSNPIFIKGEIKSINTERMTLEYGIEQYFFERDAQLPTTNITVEVKISSSGQARIIQLLQNGKPIEIKYQN